MPSDEKKKRKEKDDLEEDTEKTEIIKDFRERWKKYAAESREPKERKETSETKEAQSDAPRSIKRRDKREKKKRADLTALLEEERTKLVDAIPEVEKKLGMAAQDIEELRKKIRAQTPSQPGEKGDLAPAKREILDRLREKPDLEHVDRVELDRLEKDLLEESRPLISGPPDKLKLERVKLSPAHIKRESDVKERKDEDVIDITKLLYEKEPRKHEELKKISLDETLKREMDFMRDDISKEIEPDRHPSPVENSPVTSHTPVKKLAPGIDVIPVKEEPHVYIKEIQPERLQETIIKPAPVALQSVSSIPHPPHHPTKTPESPQVILIETKQTDYVSLTATRPLSSVGGLENVHYLPSKSRQNKLVGLVNGRRIVGLVNNNGSFSARFGDYNYLHGVIASSGKINGLVNGKNRLTGRINGRGTVDGMINGRPVKGWVNGTFPRHNFINYRGNPDGVTNGKGFVNGSFIFTNAFSQKQRRSRALELGVTFSVVFFLIGIVFFLYLPSGKLPGIIIDSNFDDWAETNTIFSKLSSNTDPNIDIIDIKVDDGSGILSFYMEVRGKWLSGSGDKTDAVQIFIDSDRSPNTGYRVHDLGADRMIMIYGIGRKVVCSELLIYDDKSSLGGLDWNAWFPLTSIRTGIDGNRLETQVHMDNLGWGKMRVADTIVHTQNYRGDEVWSPVIGNTPGLLVAEQKSTGVRVFSQSNNVKLLSFKFYASGSDITLRAINLTKSGDATLSSIIVDGHQYTVVGGKVTLSLTPSVIKANETKIFDVYADLRGCRPKSSIGFKIGERKDIWLENGTFTLSGDLTDFTGYIDSVPSSAVVDSAFGEWAGSPADPIGDVQSGNIDLTRYGVCKDRGDISFYLRVDGEMMGGAEIPWSTPEIFNYTPSPMVPDADRDTLNDSIDRMPFDFNNDGINDSDTRGYHQSIYGLDVDGDNLTDYPTGPDMWLNTTLPSWSELPQNKWGKYVVVFIGTLEIHSYPVTGEDTTRIFIDSDNDTATGYSFKGVGADYMINITGRNGVIHSKKLYRFEGIRQDEWDFKIMNIPISVGTDTRQVEIGIAAGAFNISDNASVVFTTNDWKEYEDCSLKSFNPLQRFDPFVVAGNGNTFLSPDGAAWATKTPIGVATMIDVTADPSGNYYALSTDGRTWKSSDSGVTWVGKADVGAGNNYDSIYWCSNTLYVVTTAGATYQWDTATEPVFWTQNGDNPPAGTYVGIAAIPSGTYAGVYVIRNTGQIYRDTLDFSGTWVYRGDAGNQNDYTDMTAYSTTTLYVLDDNGPIRRSLNGGANWNTLPNTPAVSNGNLYVRVERDPVSGVMWALRSNGQIYMSSNEGATAWINTGDVGGLTNYYGLAAIPEFSEYIQHTIPMFIPILVAIIIWRGRSTRKRVKIYTTYKDRKIIDQHGKIP